MEREKCWHCQGTGKHICYTCGGSGTKTQYVTPLYIPILGYSLPQTRICDQCHGTGKVNCSFCHGEGWRQ